MEHIPVLKDEVIAAFSPKSDGVYLDCTAGDGGHSKALLEASGPSGKVVALDGDPKQVSIATERLAEFGNRARVVLSPFSDLDAVARDLKITQFDGILFDLGYSSRQLSDSSYGLAFDDDLGLDMRLRPGQVTAAEWLNRANEVEIGDAFYKFGDRHNSRQLARSVVEFRRKRHFQKAQDLKIALGLDRPGMIAPIWQAIRIVINDEFGEIEAALPKALELLAPGGALAVITFHSGEDRLVKHFFARSREFFEGKPKLILPQYSEIKSNSRSRSAKLRLAFKTS